MRIEFKLKKFTVEDWLCAASAVLAVVCIILYGVMQVGEFGAGTVVLFAVGILFSLLSVFIKLPYADLAAFVCYTVAFFLFVESKAFYISAVFVGIDYKSFDACFLADFIIGLVVILLAVAASLPLTKQNSDKNQKEI